jgi:hypothetical protein
VDESFRAHQYFRISSKTCHERRSGSPRCEREQSDKQNIAIDSRFADARE